MNAHIKQLVMGTSSQEQAYYYLKERVLRLELAPGARISALEVAAQLGISRTPVREALGRLEQEALVAHDPAGGYLVRPMSVKEIDDLYKVRASLETEAVIEAMPNINADDLARLNACLDEAEKASEDVSAFLIATRKFHETIVRATGNEVLLRVLAPIGDRVRLIGAMLVQAHAMRMDEVCAENREILRAIEAKDEEAAVRAVRAHVQNAREHVATRLSQNQAIVFVNVPGIPA